MRNFSTLQARVFSNAVFMPELFPARLSIPSQRDGVPYDFTLDNKTKVSDFQQRVMDNTNDDVSSFELISTNDKDSKSADGMTLGELKQGKFRMRVNNKTYDVYPDLGSIIRDPAAA